MSGNGIMAKRIGIVREFWLFLREHKAYWLAPLIVVALLLAGIVALGLIGGGAVAPFIYTLF